MPTGAPGVVFGSCRDGCLPRAGPPRSSTSLRSGKKKRAELGQKRLNWRERAAQKGPQASHEEPSAAEPECSRSAEEKECERVSFRIWKNSTQLASTGTSCDGVDSERAQAESPRPTSPALGFAGIPAPGTTSGLLRHDRGPAVQCQVHGRGEGTGQAADPGCILLGSVRHLRVRLARLPQDSEAEWRECLRATARCCACLSDMSMEQAVGAGAPRECFDLVQHCLQSGPLRGQKPGYFKRCSPAVAVAVAAFLSRQLPDLATGLMLSEKQRDQMALWAKHASKAASDAQG